MRPLYADFLRGRPTLGAGAREAADGYEPAGASGRSRRQRGRRTWPRTGRWSNAARTAAREQPEEMRALAREVEAFTAGVDVAAADRVAELDALAGLAARVVPLEEQACAALR